MNLKSKSKVIATSALGFSVELLVDIGQEDLDNILHLSKDLTKIFGEQGKLNETNIPKYFNSNTIQFLAKKNSKLVGFIIGAPLEIFKRESWSRYDTNLGQSNTIYTYFFYIEKKYRKKGGYAKTLKHIYLNYLKKKKYKYVTGHVKIGVSENFGSNSEIVKIFQHWYGQNKPYEYYRRIL
ncbi:MAG: hypothetical protein CBD58_05335 [bacterium TMED198]|nr:MAG: hypothetical protein CBD58_05335 [bacterium TMED198]